MPRRKTIAEVPTTDLTATGSAESAEQAATADVTQGVETPAELASAPLAGATPAAEDAVQEQPQRPWVRHFETLAVIEPGISSGEDRKFAQVYIAFDKERPTDEQKAKMTEAGFRYRAAEKRWDQPANPATRMKAKALVAEFTGVILGAAQGR